MSDYLASKTLPDGRGAWVMPLTFGRARIISGPLGSVYVDSGW